MAKKKVNPGIALAQFFLDCAAKAKNGPLVSFFKKCAATALKD